MKYDRTINSDILMMASGKSDHGPIEACIELLDAIYQSGSIALVLDEEGKIEQEYKEKLGFDAHCYSSVFVSRMLTEKGKLNTVKRASHREWSAIERKLRETCLHAQDRYFVRVAMSSKSAVVVAEEKHFCDATVCKIMSKAAMVESQKAEIALECVKAIVR